MTYARYTEFEYDPARREEVLAFWHEPDTAHPTEQPGFVRGFVLDSQEQPGRLRVLTLWRRSEDFDAFFASPGHQQVGPSLGERSAKIVDRDGLESELLLVSPELEQAGSGDAATPTDPRDQAGHVRIIRARILDRSRNDELREFWRAQGRAALERAEGVHAARAYLDEAAGIFVIQVWWSDAETATAFVASEEHEALLTVPLNQWVERLDRAEAEPLD